MLGSVVAARSLTNIARRAKRLNFRPLVSEVALLEPAYRQALTLFRDSIRAFAESDCELAQTLKLRDKELDALTTDIGEKLVARATADPEKACPLALLFAGLFLDYRSSSKGFTI